MWPSTSNARNQNLELKRSILEEAHSTNIVEWIRECRRWLHQHPELMFREEETSAYIRKQLDAMGIAYEYPVATTGIVAWIGSGAEPCLALRADMDGLPIEEKTGPGTDGFRSTNGNMHACGHDMHVAMLLGAARLLKAREPSIPGTVKLIFQPAEEGGAGAYHMVQHGALKAKAGPAASGVFGMHVFPFAQVGTVGSKAGLFMAASGRFTATIHGVGGHASMPHLLVDPITTAAAAITALQTIVSRETSPFETGVISVTNMEAGTGAFNVTPPSAKFFGTVRASSRALLERLLRRIGEMVAGVAATHGCTATYEEGQTPYPPVMNDSSAWAFVKAVAADLLGPAHVTEVEAVPAAEDFSFFQEEVPGCFVFLGIVPPGRDPASLRLHSAEFEPDEAALPLGAALHASVALDYLASLHTASSN